MGAFLSPPMGRGSGGAVARAGCECASECKKMGRRSAKAKPAPPKKGTANAARVSRGSLHDKWLGLSQMTPKCDAHQHVTVTCVI